MRGAAAAAAAAAAAVAAAAVVAAVAAAASSPVASGSNGMCNTARGYCFCDTAHARRRCDGGNCETPAADATHMAGAMGNRLEQI